MSPGTIGVIGIGVLVLFLFSGMPIAFGMALVGGVGLCIMIAVEPAMNLLAIDFYSRFTHYGFTVLPMFILMGSIAFYIGASRRLYDTAYKLVGQNRGGIASSTILACAGFAAICGSGIASAATMGKVALPEMKKFNYDQGLATACIAAGATLGPLIPPSGYLIIYGLITEQPIAKLFVAGILPGIALTLLYVVTIYILCRRNPALGPAGPKTSLKEKMASLGGVVEMLVLFGMVMGGLFIGFFTPTEAGAIGAGGAFLIGLARRSLSWRGTFNALLDTARMAAMAILIVTACLIFGHFLTVTRLPFALSEWIASLNISPYAIMGAILFFYFIGGFFTDEMAMMLLTVPIFFPVVINLGFDGVWFGTMMVVTSAMGALTPPVGMYVYVVKGVAEDVPLETIFRGIWPFVIAQVVMAIFLLFYPQIALFLPSLM